MRIGIDVGGTNTDAVAMHEGEVLAWTKQPTTADVVGGVHAALEQILRDAVVDAGDVTAIMIGTTHFTNALAEARRLTPTAAIRIAPEPQELGPMVDWPARVREAIGGETYVCGGGHEFDGRPIEPLDEQRLRAIARNVRERGLGAIAISAVFSPANPEHELRARDVLAAELPDVPITMSHELGSVSLLERENATIMNACLQGLAPIVVDAFRDAVARAGLSAPLYLSQNDGTLMGADFARRYPVAAIASGPTNSMRGAAFLSGLRDCAVVDVGGTTADAGVLRHGFPRDAAGALELGGVRTNFRMPDVLSVPLGGGSVVREDGDRLTIGPDSVGFDLVNRARVFGGDTLTATDVAVASGTLHGVGDAALVADLDPELVRRARQVIDETVADAVDRMKTTKGALPVVVVGGGSVLVGERLGSEDVVRPPHAGVANAIGAAIAQVGGELDRVFSLASTTREAVLAQAREEAIERAVAAGAARASVDVVDVEAVPLSHLPDGTALRVRVKAVGDLEHGRDRDAVVG